MRLAGLLQGYPGWLRVSLSQGGRLMRKSLGEAG
jgi:hypothetical protein